MEVAKSNVPNHYDLVKLAPGFVEAAGLPQPIRNLTLTAEGTDVRAVDYYNGVLWGFKAADTSIHMSLDMGETWTLMRASVGLFVDRIIPTSDGELMLMTGYSLHKTNGWSDAPSTATFVSKATPTSELTGFLRWGFDSNKDGTKFILTEYGGGTFGSQAWTDSRKILVSVDSGETFTVARDTLVAYGEPDNTNSHIHCCCYDEWEDRFWYSEGHGNARGLYFSDDDGATWTHHEGSWPDDLTGPTMLCATVHGIVMGTDNSIAGIYVLPRTSDPANTDIEILWRWYPENGFTGLPGFCESAFRDPHTGLVYAGFETDHANVPPPIIATDGRSCTEIGKAAEMTAASGRFWRIIVVNGKLRGSCWISNTDYYTVTGECMVPQRVPHHTVFDTGYVLRGVADKNGSSMACGQSIATGSWAIACGVMCEVDVVENGLGVGGNVKLYASHSIAVGINMTIPDTCPYSFSMGLNVTNNSAFGWVAGVNSTNTGSIGQVIGNNSHCTHDNAIVLCSGENSIDDYNATIGPRDLESTSGERGLILRDFNSGRYRVSVNTSGQLIPSPASGTNTIPGLVSGVTNWWRFADIHGVLKDFDPRAVGDNGDGIEWVVPKVGTMTCNSVFGTAPTLRHNMFNGRQAVYFDGASDTYGAGIETGSSTTCTVFIVMKMEVTDAGFIFFHDHHNNKYLMCGDASGSAPYANAGTPTYRRNGLAIDASTRASFMAALNNRFSVVTIENVDFSAWDKVAYAVRLGNFAAGYKFAGYVAEIIVYAEALSSTDRDAVEQYLINTYVPRFGNLYITDETADPEIEGWVWNNAGTLSVSEG